MKNICPQLNILSAIIIFFSLYDNPKEWWYFWEDQRPVKIKQGMYWAKFLKIWELEEKIQMKWTETHCIVQLRFDILILKQDT